jgi:hypothetical protein
MHCMGRMQILLPIRQVVRITIYEIENVNFIRFYNSLKIKTRTYLFLGVYVTILYSQMSYWGRVGGGINTIK